MTSAAPPFTRKKALRVLFFGSDRISEASLNALSTCTLVRHLEAVMPDSPAWSRSHQLYKCARMAGVRVHRLPMEMDFRMTGWSLPSPPPPPPPPSFDLGVVASFGYRLPVDIIRSFPMGVLNMHPSLLPLYRGAAPIPAAIRNGDHETGVSIMRISGEDGIDVGDVLAQVRHPIQPHDTFASLAPVLAHLGACTLVDVITRLCTQPKQIHAWSQASSTIQPTNAPKIHPAVDAFVDWAREGSDVIYNRWRAHVGLLKTPLHCMFRGKMMNIFVIGAPEDYCDNDGNDVAAGTVLYDKSRKVLRVVCSDRKCIPLIEMKLDGKRRIDGEAFYNGFMSRQQEIVL